MSHFCTIIPAVKKNVAFADDLIKKLDGITLIQRSINKAKELCEDKDVFVVTDSQEIGLISERNDIKFFYKQDLRLKGNDIIYDLKYFLLRIYKRYDSILILYPYVPLLQSDTIRAALDVFHRDKCDILISLIREKHRIYRQTNSGLETFIFQENHKDILTEIKAFLVFRSDLIRNGKDHLKICPYILNDGIVEIKNYQDWWVCEKLLRQKRIIFRVIGDTTVGMGHIYRSMALAHEITDHQIIFVCDEDSRLAVNRIAGSDYPVEVFQKEQIEEAIISLHPDLVVNDMLNTSSDYVLKLKQNNIKVVSFEDLGSGASFTDITFNELYDEPVLSGENIKWGHSYFFLRDEFLDAKPREWQDKIQSILITFGGTDQHNFTQKILSLVLEFCKREGLAVHIVTGPGYLYKNELSEFIAKADYPRIRFTFATGVISKIMEQSDIAISSNGRTVYELYHMKIPSLIISQNDRETTHKFAAEENGFTHVGHYSASEEMDSVVLSALTMLVKNWEYRKSLYTTMDRINFLENKKRVLTGIEGLLA
ncbi:MAG: cytidine 5'-phosphate N-acetylneuraminic acid synthetase [Thermodesulfobacteriota bacterium]